MSHRAPDVTSPAIARGRARSATKALLALVLAVPSLPAQERAVGPTVRVWWSSELLPESPRWYTDPPPESAIRHRLERRPDLEFGDTTSPGGLSVRVDPERTYQSVLGIGTSLEDTTLYAMRKGKSRQETKEVAREILDPTTGLGMTLFRITIGTSDFSDGRSVSSHPRGFYSYRDRREAAFSVENDERLGIIDMLKLVQETAGELDRSITFFASPWSPPPWMKTSGQLIGGTLADGYAGELARYFRQFVEAYQARGIPIHAITLQNEPNFVPDDYPGMRLTWEQERDLVVATYREFRDTRGGKAELGTRLWINDHNFEYWTNADALLSSLAREGRAHYVDAVAFHNYSDSPASNASRLRERHPETDIVFTEHSEWGVSGMFNIQQYFWNWSRSYTYWVTMTTRKLDERNQGPWSRPGELSPTLLIERDPQGREWYRTPEFYLLGQFSRFIQPGALRIECDRGSADAVTLVCFLNPDQTVAMVAVNQTAEEQRFRVLFEGRQMEARLPFKTVGTYVWPRRGARSTPRGGRGARRARENPRARLARTDLSSPSPAFAWAPRRARTRA